MNTTHHGPEMAPLPLYLLTDVSPEEVFQAIGRLRKEARDEVDRLIRFLDSTDDYVSRELEEDDSDLEETADAEPSLCGLDADPRRHEGHSECSITLDGELDPTDYEPSLGSVTIYENDSQSGWAAGGSHDMEDEHDGSEPSLCGTDVMCIVDDRDLEADLGSFDRIIDQTKAGRIADLRYQTMGGWPVGHGEFDEVRPVSR